MGGEKIKSGGPLDTARGSPPHRRGKVFLTDLVRIVVGITPAWAGKSPRLPDSKPAGKDHPRVGGEKGVHLAVQLDQSGSPPRGRGKDSILAGVGLTKRITPAWAGKSPVCALIGRSRWDHPRVGGEKYDCTGQEFTNWGSHPRRRGKEQPHH